MPSRRRVILTIAIGLSAGLTILVAEQAVSNYPSADGTSTADGELVGGDFVAFYVGGRLFNENRPRLYDLEHQREVRIELLGPAWDSPKSELPFVYPPLVAALASPFSRLPFQQAFLVWTVTGLLVSVSGLVLLMHRSGATSILPLPLLLLFCFGFVPYSMNTLLGGQSSWLGMAILAILSTALLERRDYLAGAIMSLSYYRPPPFFFLLIVLCFARGRRFILGFLSGAAVLLAATVLLVGTTGVSSFLHAASRFMYGQEVYMGMEIPRQEAISVPPLVFSLTSSPFITIAGLALPFMALVWLSRRLSQAKTGSTALFGLILSITASLALSVYLLKYDLALLLIPMVLGVVWHGKELNPAKAITLLPFVGFYFEFPFRQLGVGGHVLHLSSFLFLIALGLMSWQGWHLAKRPDREASGPRAPGPTETG